MNPFFQAMSRFAMPQMQQMQQFQQMSQMGQGMNPMQIRQQFAQFKQSYQGDAKAEVKKLLQSGEMNQQLYQQLQQLVGMIK